MWRIARESHTQIHQQSTKRTTQAHNNCTHRCQQHLADQAHDNREGSVHAPRPAAPRRHGAGEPAWRRCSASDCAPRSMPCLRPRQWPQSDAAGPFAAPGSGRPVAHQGVRTAWGEHDQRQVLRRRLTTCRTSGFGRLGVNVTYAHYKYTYPALVAATSCNATPRVPRTPTMRRTCPTYHKQRL